MNRLSITDAISDTPTNTAVLDNSFLLIVNSQQSSYHREYWY